MELRSRLEQDQIELFFSRRYVPFRCRGYRFYYSSLAQYKWPGVPGEAEGNLVLRITGIAGAGGANVLSGSLNPSAVSDRQVRVTT